MLKKNETRESAHLKSRVNDYSVVPNVVSYSGLFACITPIAKPDIKGPVLIRDIATLVNTFGDPRIDPTKYCDLYAIMDVVGNGGTCYVSRVDSGKTGIYKFEVNENVTINAYSSITDTLNITFSVSQAKPFSLKAFYLETNVTTGTGDDTIPLASSKIRLAETLTNKALIKALNSALNPYVDFELNNSDHDGACGTNDDAYNSIAAELLSRALEEAAGNPIVYVIYTSTGTVEITSADTEGAKAVTCFDKDYLAMVKNFEDPIPINGWVTKQAANFEVKFANYRDAILAFKDKQYAGYLLADLTMPCTDESGAIILMSDDDRRMIHYYLKEVAAERKDCTVILSTPDIAVNGLNDVCDWVSSSGDHTDNWEYGTTNSSDYTEQSFYLNIYGGWLDARLTQASGAAVKTVIVPVAAANAVINNILTSYRNRGIQFPVAGDQGGVLSSKYTVRYNPAAKAERDQMVQHRINPIYDTGMRGVQIYGNETLNAGLTDLNAAHIARSLVYARALIDEYTETLKFCINSQVLWDTWKNYVSSNILEPLKSVNCINSYTVAMGKDTTSPEEIANRMINGRVELTFFQSAEIFNLDFNIYSSAAVLE